ncbi:hypothetical protein Tco_0116766 [Tanacetum coccineum]
MLDFKGFIHLMTPAQALKLIQVMADHLHNWYDGATTRDSINDSSDNVDTKKLKENILAIQESFKIYEGAHLTKECPLEKEDKTVKQSKYIGYLEETIIKYYDESIKNQAANDEWIRKFIENTNLNLRALDTTTRNLLRKILTPTIHTLPDLEPVVQPYMPLGPVRDEVKVVREEELECDIPLQDCVMQALTPHIVYITPPDDDYVAPPTNPILDKHLNEFGKKFFDMTWDNKSGNFIKDIKELLIKTHVECSHSKEMEFEVKSSRIHVAKMLLFGRNLFRYAVTNMFTA